LKEYLLYVIKIFKYLTTGINMTVITRFAPSPTGYLHIGGARTALFNYLFAKNKGGKFLLRIEDTDRERSSDAAIKAILDGMKWLGLDWDDQEIYQFSRKDRHAEVAREMIKSGKAYYCYSTQEEIIESREKARAEGKSFHFHSPWRDRDAQAEMDGVRAVIRIKVPHEGTTVIKDEVQGNVVVANQEIDDMVLLRSDGTPTYMLAVVVDDHDMNITHIIRGDDHLTNAARQIKIYEAMGWDVPSFSHIPLIHGADGAKLSKRHGAIPVDSYRDMGFLPEAVCNYLLRLGWSHGDDEIISRTQAIEWFDLKSIGKSAAKFDLTKLTVLNGHYIANADNDRLLDLIAQRVAYHDNHKILDSERERILRGIEGLKKRAKTILELAEMAMIYVHDHVNIDDENITLIISDNLLILKDINDKIFKICDDWKSDILMNKIKEYCKENNYKMADVTAIIRVALCGKKISPSVFEMMVAFGKQESLRRISELTVKLD
jgi:glutamyl-tRNA synthetase